MRSRERDERVLARRCPRSNANVKHIVGTHRILFLINGIAHGSQIIRVHMHEGEGHGLKEARQLNNQGFRPRRPVCGLYCATEKPPVNSSLDRRWEVHLGC